MQEKRMVLDLDGDGRLPEKKTIWFISMLQMIWFGTVNLKYLLT